MTDQDERRDQREKPDNARLKPSQRRGHDSTDQGVQDDAGDHDRDELAHGRGLRIRAAARPKAQDQPSRQYQGRKRRQNLVMPIDGPYQLGRVVSLGLLKPGNQI